LNLVEETNKVEILVGREEVDTLPVLHLDGPEVGGGGGTRGDGEFRMGKATCSMVLIYKKTYH